MQITIVGSGVVGLAIARSLLKQFPAVSVRILEKESKPGLHTSGRNSGVLHAGFYYRTDSKKANFCKEGNRQWTQFCLENNVPIRQCGKIVTAQSDQEIPRLRALYEQGQENSVDLRMISMAQARSMEPSLVGHGKECIYSPTTSVMDTGKAIQLLKRQLEAQGVRFEWQTQFVAFRDKVVETSKGSFATDFLINAAGLESLRIAHELGFAKDLIMIPFKGRYAISKLPQSNVKMLVYPVPQPGANFLGVHSTVTVDDFVKVGPTIFPAFANENYDWFESVSLRSLSTIGFGYYHWVKSKERALIFHFLKNELHKSLSLRKLTSDVGKLQDFGDTQFAWYKSGIRPQLLSLVHKTLVNDFVSFQDHQQLHLLNVVSPGWTCAFPLADWVVNQVLNIRNSN